MRNGQRVPCVLTGKWFRRPSLPPSGCGHAGVREPCRVIFIEDAERRESKSLLCTPSGIDLKAHICTYRPRKADIQHGGLEARLLPLQGGGHGRHATGHGATNRCVSQIQSPPAAPSGTGAHSTSDSARHETGGDAIVRLPIPSADPADPLNWGSGRKLTLLSVASFYAFTANFIGSNIAPALTLWFTEFPQEPKPYSELVYFIAVRRIPLILQPRIDVSQRHGLLDDGG